MSQQPPDTGAQMPPGRALQSVSCRHPAGTHIRTLRWNVPAGTQIAPPPHAESEVQVAEAQTLPPIMTTPLHAGASGVG